MDMTGQPQLWTPAVEAMHFQMLWEGHSRWTLHVNWRRQGHGWDDELADFYSGLNSDELADVASSALVRLLGL